MRDAIKPQMARGEVRGHHVPDTFHAIVQSMLRETIPDSHRPPRWQARTNWNHNDILYEWGALVGRLLLRQGLNYGIGGMYIEYANVASPGDPVSVPTVTRDADQGVDYYNDLSDSADLDYLRVPLIAGTIDSSDAVKFPKSNQLTFFAQTSGVEGVHGKPFSDANNSVAYGGALVAFVDDSDYTQDLVLSRFYFEVDEQMAKLATGQIGYEWKLLLT